MKTFVIEPINKSLESAIQEKIDNLNKPKGALGRLEEIAMQVCLIQQSLNPSLTHPCHLLFGGDHGIEREGVSVSPREVTWQQMKNFTHGGGGVNMFCRQHGFKLRIIDVGVDYDLSTVEGIINRKIARGTKNFLYEPAMSEAEFDQAIQVGSELVDDCIAEGCKLLCIGEMGIEVKYRQVLQTLLDNIKQGKFTDSEAKKLLQELLAVANVHVNLDKGSSTKRQQ